MPLILILWGFLVTILSLLISIGFENQLSYNSLKFVSWDQILVTVTDIEALGQILYFFYPLPILIISIILLIAMVGALLLTFSPGEQIRRQDVYTSDIVSYNYIIREIEN